MASSVSASTPTCSVCTLHAEAVFRVEGMDCQEEVVILERRLSPLGGIESVSADLMGQRLHVKYDAARLTVAAMVDAVGQTGMRMWLEHDEPAAAGTGTEWRWRLMVGSAAAIAFGLAFGALGDSSAAATAFTVAAVVGGIYPARRAVSAVRSGTLDINTLMVVAVAGALLLGQWFEAASVVFLFAVAQWLEVRTLARARQAIRALVDLAPREAVVRRAGVEHRTPVEEVRVGDEILIKPGEKLPLDGVVVAGCSEVNAAPLTGESVPVARSQGDEVFAGTINGRGALDVRVTRLVRDTRVSRILHLVEAAQATRAPVQSFVDRFARVYTPAVLVFAFAVGALPPLVAGADPAVWVYRALVLLVIACPCALVISTPVSIVSALSAAARNGVLVKGGAHLERLAAVRVVAFDKTGTLTTGAFRVVSVEPMPDVLPEQLLAYAAAVESRAEHPVAAAVTEYARSVQMAIPAATGFVSLPGLGGEGVVAGAHVLVGNLRLMTERTISVPPEPVSVSSGDAGNALTIFVAIDGVCQGRILLEDRPRSNAVEAIGLLREHGVTRIAMLTGDHDSTAARVAAELGLDEYHAQLLPEQKHALIGALRSRYGPVLMAGDGINDAPALAAADVGMAMGAAGSDIALETADVALMSDELLRLPYAIRLAQATLRNVRMNVAMSLALKSAFLVMAVAGMATLWMAVLADTGASVIVVGNALRLLRAR